MCEFSEKELLIFCKTAKVIIQKGHLEIKAILKFIGSKNQKLDKIIIKKLYKLQLLSKHRTNTYELSSFGRMMAMDKCEWFEKFDKHTT